MGIIKKILPYIFIVLLVIVVRVYIFTPITVNGESMQTALHHGDVILLNKAYKNIERFDIVVINLNDNKPLIKRIIGLPGEHIRYTNNKLYINNIVIEEEFIREDTENFSLLSLGYNYIPDDMYFVMGDNRNDSVDSRKIGLINKKDIVGKTSLILFPFNRFGTTK
ncbi:MAG: signal peptidase I [Bacilli bacterium]